MRDDGRATTRSGTAPAARWPAAAVVLLALAASAAAQQPGAEGRRPDTQTSGSRTGWAGEAHLTESLLDARRGGSPGPRLEGALPADARHRLAAGYALASARLHENASCRALFAGLDAGADVLAEVRFRDGRGNGACVGGVRAFTCVGCRRIQLCAGFAELEVPAAALIVLHETLHAAGLGESPADPEAPAAAEINTMVMHACQLR